MTAQQQTDLRRAQAASVAAQAKAKQAHAAHEAAQQAQAEQEKAEAADRELLKLAAKAAGIPIVPCTCSDKRWPFKHDSAARGKCGHWNPLVSDSDALRLAADLKIDLEWQATGPFPEPHVEAYRRAFEGSYFCATEHENDYRRAIVRVAADITEKEGGTP